MIQVIVPVYNNPDWLDECLQSIARQSYTDYQVTIINDASTDPGVQMVARSFQLNRGWNVIQNEVNQKCPHNIWDGIKFANPADDDIIFIVDGDDWIPDNALEVVAGYYDMYPWIMLTYGQYRTEPRESTAHPAEPYPSWVDANGLFCVYSTNYNHPLTFKKKLWDRLEEGDLQFEDGSWYDAAYDETIMYPMLELSCSSYIKLDEELYVYRADNPASEWLTANDRIPAIVNDVRRRRNERPWEFNDTSRLAIMNSVFHLANHFDEFTIDVQQGDAMESYVELMLEQFNGMGLETRIDACANIVEVHVTGR